MRDRCPHRDVRLVWTRYSGYGDTFAARQLRQQCLECFQIFGSSLKHSHATAETPELSQEEATRCHREQEARWEAEQARREAEFEEQRQQRQDQYNNYLQTPEWRTMRNRILRRDGGLCRGCSEAPAAEVHHLTYDHIGNEFDWELVAICRRCHQRYHEEFRPIGEAAQRVVERVAGIINKKPE